MRYQDDVFNDNATPPPVLISLGAENKKKSGIVEAYIYRQFEKKFTQMLSALSYCQSSDRTSFQLEQFLDIFWKEPGLKRSIDKIYEIVVYSLFEVLVEELDISVEVFIGSQKNALLKEFEDFAKKVLCLDSTKPSHKVPARFNRVGVTNAADRGLDMWANYGPAVQIKHLSLDEDLAEEIVNSVSADRIIIVCMDSEQKVIVSLLNQIGWKSRIQAIITQKELILWYEKALRGSYAKLLGAKLLSIMISEIKNEFPTISSGDFDNFVNERGYGKLNDKFWNIRQDG
jgi:type II restriction enzyme